MTTKVSSSLVRYDSRTIQDKLREIVSVDDFGAVGDGSTDDSSAVQAAITAVGGGAVFFSDKTYLLSGLTVSSDGAALFGKNIYGSRIRFTDTDGTLLTVTGSLFQMANFEIETPSATHTAGSIIDVQGGQGRVSNVRITGNFWDVFKLETDGKGGWCFDSIRVTGSNTLNSLFRVKGTAATVADNHVFNILSATTVAWTEGAVILDTLTDTFTINGGTLGGVGKLIHCKNSGSAQAPRYIHIDNVRLEGNPGATDAVTIDAVDDFRFSGGYVGQSDNAFVVNGGRDIVMRNSHIIKMQRTALDLNGGARVFFEDNTVLDCSQEADVTYSCVDIAANVSEWRVKGNTFRTRPGVSNKPLRPLTIAPGTSNKFSYGDNDWGVAGIDFGSAGDPPVSDGSTGTSVVIEDSIPTLLYRGGAAISHTGTTDPTVKVTATLPAGALRTRDGIEIFAAGTTSGTGGVKEISLTFGGQVLSLIQIPQANTDTWTVRATVFNANATDAQVFIGQATRTAADTEGNVVRNKSAALAVDTSSDVTVTVTCQLGNASDSIVIRLCDIRVIRR